MNDSVFMEEVRLYENHAERERIDNLAELYAVLNSLECLEKVFSRDCILPKEYTAECSKLLVQYKVTLKLLRGMNTEEFVHKYRINCPAALERIREDRPITVRDDRGNVLKNIAEIVELFITFMDQIKLNIRTVDQLFPTLNDLYSAMISMSSLPEDSESKTKVQNWYNRLNGMSATDEISEDDSRQMFLEIETAYNAFQRYLHNT
ncbi:Vacuolar protein sorting-associated protein 28-like protein [Aphelenchoides besseyi]|nr:Vacuolar protein sorting-associated protein 28-like protein [Aphelenchoides besseyi]KAI6207844.1 Vacuolar protein sorting-associated protein 28-like protein [Aphelenchoides besseyi]